MYAKLNDYVIKLQFLSLAYVFAWTCKKPSYRRTTEIARDAMYRLKAIVR